MGSRTKIVRVRNRIFFAGIFLPLVKREWLVPSGRRGVQGGRGVLRWASGNPSGPSGPTGARWRPRAGQRPHVRASRHAGGGSLRVCSGSHLLREPSEDPLVRVRAPPCCDRVRVVVRASVRASEVPACLAVRVSFLLCFSFSCFVLFGA